MRRKARCSIIVLSVAVLLTACGNQKKDTIADDLRENVGSDASAGNAVKNSGTDEIPENISYVVEVGGNTTKVDAKIYADGYGQVPTLSTGECTDKDEWVLKYAKRIFDDGEFKNVKPYRVLSREELEAELQFYQEKYSESNEYHSEDQTWYIEQLLENYNEENYIKYPDDKIVYEAETSGSDEESDYTEVIDQAKLRGTVDGRTWEISYTGGYSEFSLNGETYKTEYLPSIDAHCVDEEYWVTTSSNISETYLNNLCNREDAEKQAEEFLHRLGFGEMELLHIVQNNLQSENEELKVDGYTMVFGFKRNGAHLLFATGNLFTVTKQDVDAYSAGQPFVEVAVNSNGIYSITIMGCYDEAKVMSNESSMLSFEQINDIAKERITEIMTEYPNSYFDISTIEFGYVYITYDGLSYAVVPVWRFYDGDRHEKFRSAVITICALDGAEIYPGTGSAYSGSGTIPY